MTFRYGDFGFGVRVEDVAGMIEADRLAPLPRHAEGLAGLVAFRGDMIPVLHLASYLGLEGPVRPGDGYAIILSRGAERFGILVHDLPKLVPARELRAAEVTDGVDGELDGLIDSVFQAADEPFHCLNYGRIFDAIIPPPATANGPRASRH